MSSHSCVGMRAFLALVAALLSCPLLSQGTTGLQDGVFYYREPFSKVAQLVKGDPLEFEKTRKDDIDYWLIELLEPGGLIKWGAISGPTVASVKSQLASGMRLEEFWCKNAMKATAPCDRLTHTNPKGPIAVLKKSGSITRQEDPVEKKNAGRLSQIIDATTRLAGLFINLEHGTLPKVELDTPFRSFVERLKNMREEAHKLQGRLDEHLLTFTDDVERLFSAVQVLEKDLPKSVAAATQVAAPTTSSPTISSSSNSWEFSNRNQKSTWSKAGVFSISRTATSYKLITTTRSTSGGSVFTTEVIAMGDGGVSIDHQTEVEDKTKFERDGLHETWSLLVSLKNASWKMTTTYQGKEPRVETRPVGEHWVELAFDSKEQALQMKRTIESYNK